MTTVTVYAITNLTAVQANPADLANYIRGHWSIEALHHIRDVTYADYAELLVMPTVAVGVVFAVVRALGWVTDAA